MTKNKSIFIIFIALLLILSSFIPVSARKADGSYEASDFTGLEQWCFEMAEKVYGGSNTNLMNDIVDILSFSPKEEVSDNVFEAINAWIDGDSSAVTKWWTDATDNETTTGKYQNAKDAIWMIVTYAYESLSPLGFAIVLLYFVLDILDKTTREQLTIEHFLRQFIKLIVAIFIIQNGLKLLLGFLGIGNDLIETLSKTISSANLEVEDSPLQIIGKDLSGIFSKVYAAAYMASMIIPYLCVTVAELYIIIMAWSRLIEIGIRAAFAPIGMSDLMVNGFSGNGFRYLKKFIATVIQGAVIVAIVIIVQAVYGGITVNKGVLGGQVSVWPLDYIMILFVEIGLIKRCSSFANDILGV